MFFFFCYQHINLLLSNHRLPTITPLAVTCHRHIIDNCGIHTLCIRILFIANTIAVATQKGTRTTSRVLA